MTFIGKLFVMLNLAISLLMASPPSGCTPAASTGPTAPPRTGQPAGKMLALRKEIDEVLAQLALAEGGWKAARAELVAREERRRQGPGLVRRRDGQPGDRQQGHSAGGGGRCRPGRVGRRPPEDGPGRRTPTTST